MSGPIRLLVCGGRDFTDADAVNAVLDRVHAKRGIVELIEGGAPGADRLAREWARRNGIGGTQYPADWKRHGRAAGPLRNAAMLADGKPDGVVAFPGGVGTADMVRRAQEAGVPVWEPLRATGVARA